MLTCTYYHILGDGMRLIGSLAELSRAYRGESLEPLGRWLHRDLLFPENIHQLIPGGKRLVDEAREAIKVSDETCNQGYQLNVQCND